MKRFLPLTSTRAAQVAFLILLGTSVVMLYWWLFDQRSLRASFNESWQERYAGDRALAATLLAEGVPAELLLDGFPHLEIVGDQVWIKAEALEALHEDAQSHLNRYRWEGGFFLVVLLASIGVLWQVLQREAELRQRQENFLAAVSHELKTPLASLQLATETLVQRDPPPEKRARLLSRNLADLQRLEALVSNLLDSSRLSEGRMVLERRPVILAEAVERAVAEVGPFDGEAGPRIEVRVPAELEIEADPVGLGTVLRNLIENALKASRSNGTLAITVEGVEEHGQVRLRVCDCGVGFPPEEASRLFEKFYRPGDELRRRSPGTGLGLYIVQRFMQLEGGSVTAHSDGPGRGAVFTLAWPAAR